MATSTNVNTLTQLFLPIISFIFKLFNFLGIQFSRLQIVYLWRIVLALSIPTAAVMRHVSIDKTFKKTMEFRFSKSSHICVSPTNHAIISLQQLINLQGQLWTTASISNNKKTLFNTFCDSNERQISNMSKSFICFEIAGASVYFHIFFF